MSWKRVAQQRWALTADVEHDVAVVQLAVHKIGDKCVECMRRQRPLDGSYLSQCTETRWQDMIDVSHHLTYVSSSCHRRCRHRELSWRRCLECGGHDGQVHIRRTLYWTLSVAARHWNFADIFGIRKVESMFYRTALFAWSGVHPLVNAILDFQKLKIITSGPVRRPNYASSLSPRRSWQRDIARYYVKNRNIFLPPTLPPPLLVQHRLVWRTDDCNVAIV